MATSPATIQTDSYGDVPKAMFHKWRRLNVTPAEHDALRDRFGNDFKAMTAFVAAHTENGSYREPWPFD